MTNRLKQLTLLLGDLATFYLTLYLTLAVRYQQLPESSVWQDHVWPFTLVFSSWLLIFYIANLYNLYTAVNNSAFWRNAASAIFTSGLIAALIFYLLPIGISPKTNLAIYFGLFVFIFPLWRQFFNWTLASYLPKMKVAFIGLNPEAEELINFFQNNKQAGYQVAIALKETDEAVNNLPQLVKDHSVSLIVVATNLNESDNLRNQLFACLPYNASFTNLPLFYERITGKVPINVISQTWFLENLTEGGRSNFNSLKRVFDLLGALILLTVTAPFWLLVAALTKLESKGPVFFVQTRQGKNGTPFNMIKFRTMRSENNNFTITVEGDNRITRVGNFWRKSRIDELPQLLNIIKGEMSFVGPRPERVDIAADLAKAIPFYHERTLVKPGVTGWDQVSGEYHSPTKEDTIKKLQYDLYYIKNRSMYLDLSVILKTIYTVLSRSGR